MNRKQMTPKSLVSFREMKRKLPDKFSNNHKFNAFYKALPYDERRFVKNAIIDECGISSVIFTHWVRNETPISNEYTQKIIEICAEDIFHGDKITSSIDEIK